jgi:hypothetical protein
MVRDALGALNDFLPSCDAETTNQLVGVFDALGRAGGAGWALAAHRGLEIDAHALTGHRNATDWLAQSSGVPFARAKDALTLAEHISASMPVREAFLRGELSLSQAQTIADTVAVDPACGEKLLGVAQSGSHQELCRQATRIRQSARSREDERSRRARAFRRRSLRFCQLPEGGVRVQLLLTEEAWGHCLPAIEREADVRFRLGRKAKVHSTRDQYRADALVALLSGKPAGGGEGTTRTSVTCVVRVDASALRRGSVESGEMCEIAGVGLISVDTARDLLGEGYVRLLVKDGVDVTTITGRVRTVPARVEAALFERDLSCVVPDCGVSIGLQTHHWRKDVRFQGPTVLDNLCRMCCIHHDLVTTGGWKLTGGPGRWKWQAPDWPVSEKLRSQRRRVAALRARSPSD